MGVAVATWVASWEAETSLEGGTLEFPQVN